MASCPCIAVPIKVYRLLLSMTNCMAAHSCHEHPLEMWRYLMWWCWSVWQAILNVINRVWTPAAERVIPGAFTWLYVQWPKINFSYSCNIHTFHFLTSQGYSAIFKNQCCKEIYNMISATNNIKLKKISFKKNCISFILKKSDHLLLVKYIYSCPEPHNGK